MKEKDLAKPIVAWLRDDGWEVYQEVMCNGSVADIVAERDGIIWAIETKTTLTIALIDQIIAWKPYAHYISVGIPHGKKSGRGGRRFGISILHLMDHYGFGIITAKGDHVTEVFKPTLNKNMINRLKFSLREEQKDYVEAGSANGGYWTPFKKTSEDVINFIKENKGCDIKDLVSGIEHHYASNSSARASITKYLQDGVIPGVKVVNDDKKFRFYFEP